MKTNREQNDFDGWYQDTPESPSLLMLSIALIVTGILLCLLFTGCTQTPAIKRQQAAVMELAPKAVIVATNQGTVDVSWIVDEPWPGAVYYSSNLHRIVYLRTGLESHTNLAHPIWVTETNLPLPLTYSNKVTLPLAGQRFFRAKVWDQ
jgi:hypothetical protein